MREFCYPPLLNLPSDLSHLIGKLILSPLLFLSLLSLLSGITSPRWRSQRCLAGAICTATERHLSLSLPAHGLGAWAPAWPPPSHHQSQVSWCPPAPLQNRGPALKETGRGRGENLTKACFKYGFCSVSKFGSGGGLILTQWNWERFIRMLNHKGN